MKNYCTRLFRYATVALPLLAVELAILFVFLHIVTIPYVFAVPVVFLLVFSVFYFLVRPFAFYGTTRTLSRGYGYFMVIALLGMSIVTITTTILVAATAIHPLLARLFAGGLSGFANFTTNAVFNFAVVAPHIVKNSILEPHCDISSHLEDVK